MVLNKFLYNSFYVVVFQNSNPHEWGAFRFLQKFFMYVYEPTIYKGLANLVEAIEVFTFHVNLPLIQRRASFWNFS